MNAERYKDALNWLVDLYQDDFRKSSGTPALGHPLGVMELTMGAGGDEDTCIAALFHDFGEDKGGEEILQEIECRFGARVARIVRDCSDTLPTGVDSKEPWIVRKVEHIRHIAHLEADSCLVLTADTLHNTRDHLRGVTQNGDTWWDNFRSNVYIDRERTRDIGQASTLWYLDLKSMALNNRAHDFDFAPLCVITGELKEVVYSLFVNTQPNIKICDEVYDYVCSTYNLRRKTDG